MTASVYTTKVLHKKNTYIKPDIDTYNLHRYIISNSKYVKQQCTVQKSDLQLIATLFEILKKVVDKK